MTRVMLPQRQVGRSTWVGHENMVRGLYSVHDAQPDPISCVRHRYERMKLHGHQHRGPIANVLSCF